MASMNNSNMGHIIIHICVVHTMWLSVCVCDCPWVLSVCSHSCPAQVCSSIMPFCSKMLLFFFSLQFWKSSHCCCIDTPVEGPGEESSEPADQPHDLSLLELHIHQTTPPSSLPHTHTHSTYCHLAPHFICLYMLIMNHISGHCWCML